MQDAIVNRSLILPMHRQKNCSCNNWIARIGGLLLCIASGHLAAATALTSPTVSQFLNAANVEYILAGIPAGMTPFKVNGVPMILADNASGAVSAVWVTPSQQIIIAYQGTSGGEYLITNPIALFSQVLADADVSLTEVGISTPAMESSLKFAKQVMAAAQSQGYSPNNIFVTGHSLGGIEAEYVSSQTGLGGMSFEASGLGLIATMSNQNGAGANFVNVVTWGDPIGSICSDVPGGLLGYNQGGGGLFPHFGGIVAVGDPNNQLLNNIATIFINLPTYHMPGVQAHATGVTLTPSSLFVDFIGNLGGPVYNVASDTIPELIENAKSMGKYYPG